jgi:hypothetical protein
VASLKARPGDFVLDSSTITDRRTHISVWIRSGRGFISLMEPLSETFAWRYRRRIWRAVHEFRHRTGNALFNHLKAAMADAPLPSPAPAKPALPWRRPVAAELMPEAAD